MATARMRWRCLAVAAALVWTKAVSEPDVTWTVACVDHVFRCEDGSCIPYHNRCDGLPHCPDRSDEITCEEADGVQNVTCSENQFACADGSGCVPKMWRCNQEPDCMDGSDELNCNITDTGTCIGFMCNNGRCISKFWQCDNEFDCVGHEDEANCTGNKYVHGPPARLSIICNIDMGYFPCEDSSFCLKEDAVCNGHVDCKDGSDEKDLCSETCDKIHCSNGCMRTPYGARCRCPEGFTHVSATECRDVDECAEEADLCTQRCENHHGNYTCSCDEGYELRKDLYTCNVKDGEGILFYNTRDSVKALYLRSRKTATIASHTQQAVGVACDGRYVYWTEVNAGHEAIMRAELDDPAHTKEAIVTTGLETPEDVAVDWITGALYFTDGARAHVAACSSDGYACSVLVAQQVYRPRAIELDVRRGQMYWSDWGDVPRIARANMDGSDVTTFVDHNVSLPNGLSLDVHNDRLYWVDAKNGGIESIRLDGSLRVKVLENTVHHPYWLSVFESQLYWSDWGTDTLQVVNKFQDRFRRTLVKGRIYGIQVYHPAMEQRKEGHACEHGLCSDLCLLRGALDYACVCSEGRELSQDNHTCHNVVRPHYVLVTGGSAAAKVEVHTLGRLDVAPAHIQIGRIDAVAYNGKDDVVYLYDGVRRAIVWLHLDDLGLGRTTDLVTDGLHKVEDMAYDEVSDVLYWIDSGAATVEVYSVRRDVRALLYKLADDEQPVSLTVIPEYGMLLLSTADASGAVHVDSLGADGSGRKHLFEHGFKGPVVRVRYHSETDLLYITDSGSGIIESAHPHGTGREVFRALSTRLWSAAGAGAELLWTDAHSDALYWTNVHLSVGAPVRKTRLDMFAPHTQLLVTSLSRYRLPSDGRAPHPCAAHTTPCAQVCLQREVSSSNSARYRCLCAAGSFLSRDGACQPRAACASGAVLCARSNQCVPGERRCDGRADCLHGEDEEDCSDHDGAVNVCSGGRFACGSGECVSARRRCDGRSDCRDGADELGCEDHVAAQCAESTFDCGGGVCVDRRLVCDAANDCPDGSDEADCALPGCDDGQYQCTVGSCVPASWECDGEIDCSDASDEHVECTARDTAEQCGAEQWVCAGGGCVALAARCDAHDDCADGSDEWDCSEAPPVQACDEEEYMCLTNRSICLPIEAKCNGSSECPRGEDEAGCAGACAADEARCGDGRCLAASFVCDRVEDCRDGSDETAQACLSKNVTLVPPEPGVCGDGFSCDSGHCLDLHEVCDGIANCPDGSDEHGACETACAHHECSMRCVATPRGARCACVPGYQLAADGRACVDRNECAVAGERRACAHTCTNIEGGFVCTCHEGYVLRSDRRSCKAAQGSLQTVLAARGTVWLAPARALHHRQTLLEVPDVLTDLAVDTRAGFVYAASAAAGRVYRTSLRPDGQTARALSNIGAPNKLAVDWLSGVVYVAGGGGLRACSFRRDTCAELSAPPAPVTALAADPPRALLVYCAARALVRVGADGAGAARLAEGLRCSALAVDTWAASVYVAHDDGLAQVHLDGSLRRDVARADARVAAPRSLGYFEDSLYLLSERGDKFLHCRLFGGLTCDSVYLSGERALTAAAVVHAALQPGGGEHEAGGGEHEAGGAEHEAGGREHEACAACPADTVCVRSPERAHLCLCAGGEVLARGAQCPSVEADALAVFSGAETRAGVAAGGGGGGGGRLALILLSLVLLLVASACGLMAYLRRTRAARPRTPLSVYFRSRRRDEESRRLDDEPVVHISPPALGGSYTEFVNPLRSAWRAVQSRVGGQHAAHAALHVDADRQRLSKYDNSWNGCESARLTVPRADPDSDVESDRDTAMDVREKARLLFN